MGPATQRRSILGKWVLVVVVLLALAALAAGSAIALSANQFQASDRIADNVRIQGVAVGKMTTVEAVQAVRQQWASRLPELVDLNWVGGVAQASPEQLGARLQIRAAVDRAHRVGREGSLFAQTIARWRLSRTGVDMPVDIEVDRSLVEAHLVGLAATVNRKPRNADFEVRGDTVDVIPGEVGIDLDIEATADGLADALTDPSLSEFELVTKIQPPTIRAEDLKHLEVVLASYTTSFKSWQRDRTHNLAMAIKNLSRAVVMPGEVLSFNERVGPRLSEKGWRAAPIFIDGEIEPSTGGGICQVASTVYNAALLANLEVVERHHHSRPVTYVPSGRDATVYWGQFDLRVRNTLKHPILILGEIGEDQLTIKILGSTADQSEVEIVRSGVSTVAFSTKEVPDPELEEGKRETEKPGRNGTRVTVSRIVKKGDEVVNKERLHSDSYAPQAEVIKVGTKKPEVAPEAVEDAPKKADDTAEVIQEILGGKPKQKPADPPAASTTPSATGTAKPSDGASSTPGAGAQTD